MVAEGETAILVKYELEGQLYAPDGVTVITEKSNSVKKIKVKTLNASTDLDALAAEIVEKCKLIHHSKTSHVRDLLAKLRDRDAPDARVESGTRRKGASHRSRTRHQRRARVGRVPSFVLVDGAFPIVVASLVRRMGRGGEGTRTPVESRRQYRCRFIFHPRRLARRVRLGRRRRRRRDGTCAFAGRRMLAEAEEEGAFDAHASVPVHLPQCKAHIQDMDDYLEQLYDEDMAVKVDATLHVAALAKTAENLDALAEHPLPFRRPSRGSSARTGGVPSISPRTSCPCSSRCRISASTIRSSRRISSGT